MKKNGNNNGDDDDGQGDLFADYGEAWARHSDPDTSHEAAEEVRGEKASRMENQVLQCLLAHAEGLIMHEISDLTGIPWNSCSPRARPLCRKGLIRDSGRRRLGKFGKMCVVWEATEKARSPIK